MRYVQEDLAGHLERSGGPLRLHADPTSELNTQQRIDYFYGMTTMFPPMFLGHYYQWLELPEPKNYMQDFFPHAERWFGPCNQALLDKLFAASDDSGAIWLASLCSYLAYYPYALLERFGLWAFPEDLASRVRDFVQTDRARTLPGLIQRLSACCGSAAEQEKAVYWLGTQFPYDLLTRFHQALFDI